LGSHLEPAISVLAALAVILIAACLGGRLARRVRQPRSAAAHPDVTRTDRDREENL
jgi:hypothetical protein